MANQKYYRVSIGLYTIEINVRAKNKSEARKKALERLDRKKPSSMIRRNWHSNRKEIDVYER